MRFYHKSYTSFLTSLSAADFANFGVVCGNGIVAAVDAADPVHQVGPGDQIGTAYDPAGKLAGTDGPAEGVFADGHTVFLGSGDGLIDLQNFKVSSIHIASSCINNLRLSYRGLRGSGSMCP